MSRSADRRSVLLGVLLAGCVLVAEPAVARAEPTAPVPVTTIVPGPRVAPGESVTAPVVDLETPTREIYLQTGDLDGVSREAESSDRIELVLAADVLFAFGKADLSPAARDRLAQVAERLRVQARGTVRIDGHTDAIGSDAANLALSRRRAEAVRDVLRGALSGTSLAFEVTGFGESRPVASESKNGRDNPAGRARNRRVEIRFDK
ncbi:OmpA family protein [Plantactinospora solaniradicis]|uniref:OmpA family protein n=1 Tax=Plantactinospora solaniradicis TaxID=1723736 RepID=A0ABW1K7J9_9ACTN